MSVETISALRLTRTVRADRQAVWEAWTRPEHVVKWACPAPDGVQSYRSDFRVGGSFDLVMEVDGTGHHAFGTYREIDEPNRLVYTWDWKEEENAMGETLVTVEFHEVDGGTEVILVHAGFPATEAKDGHDEGWKLCLDHFEALFA
jgi:uncharacterized protein YndB with AHSA1/START domain